MRSQTSARLRWVGEPGSFTARCAVILTFTTSFCLGTMAQAAPMLMNLVPEESWVQIGAGSEVSLDLSPYYGTRVLPLETQVGARPGVSGATLPEGGVSDGLRTNLEGTLLVDVDAGQIQLYPQLSLISPVDSGLWLPGLPGDTGTPAAADLAVAFSSSDPAFDGSAAFRESILNPRFPATTLVDEGGGIQSFAPLYVIYQFAAGLLDYDLGLEGAADHTALDTLQPVWDREVVGSYQDLGGGVMRVALPFAFDLLVYDTDIRGPVPATVSIALSGEIVATVVPEPGTAVLLGVGCLGLAAAARHRARLIGKEAE